MATVWTIVLVGATAACGRIGFDPRGESSLPEGFGDAPASVGSDAICDPAQCGFLGGTCVGTTCRIAVTTNGVVACPPNHDCVFDCNAPSACSGSLACSGAHHCTFNCNAQQSCNSTAFYCANGGNCTVYCRNSNTCNSASFFCVGVTCDLECCQMPNACNQVFGTTPHNNTCP